MEIHGDLHSHSIFAGGAGGWAANSQLAKIKMEKRFISAAINSPLKGINLLGTGDCQFKPWREFLKDNLKEEENGIYEFDFEGKTDESGTKIRDDLRYILQTEVIFTGPTPNSTKKKKAHTVILFPNFEIVDDFNILLEKMKVSHQNMARPFIVSDTIEEIESKVHMILDLDKGVELIPAHIMTPEGIYGSNQRINYLFDFFGTAAKRINAIETGLSADPKILSLIPELDNIAFLSNADAHSAALNRVGREFTSFNLQNLSYQHLIDAIRKNNISKTAEFHPSEGRYFLTGHRSMRKRPGVHTKQQKCYFSPNNVPDNDICPICGKELTVGVLQRAFEISAIQNNGDPRTLNERPLRDFVTMVPLVEIVAHSLGIKSLISKRVIKIYHDVIADIGTEIGIWIDSKPYENSLLPENLVIDINMVKKGNFSFQPIGYDGEYGKLKIGETQDYLDIEVVNA